MEEALRAAITDAVTMHEIGHGDPYRLSFAGKGKSGASFGRMQGDVSTDPRAREMLRQVLAAARITPSDIEAVLKALTRPAKSNPLAPMDQARVDAALASPAGRRLVDQMDRQILDTLLGWVEECVAAAARTHRRIEPAAIICIALWINMSGPPTTLKQWLSGNDVWLDHRARRLAAPGAVVTVLAIEEYMRATDYFSANPGNFPSLQLAVGVGEARLA